jgi:ubiquinone biosynthesis protein UbiJ
LFAGQKFSFNVFSDPESINLVQLIDATLKSAGWVRIGSQVGDIVVNVAGETAGTAHGSGVQIGIKRESSREMQALAVRLAQALTSEELSAIPQLIAELKFDDAININVGKKP